MMKNKLLIIFSILTIMMVFKIEAQQEISLDGTWEIIFDEKSFSVSWLLLAGWLVCWAWGVCCVGIHVREGAVENDSNTFFIFGSLFFFYSILFQIQSDNK